MTGTFPIVHDVVIQPDGRIIAVGDFDGYNGYATHDIVRINPDGSPDMTFLPGTDIGFQSVALAPEGKLIVSGFLPEYQGSSTGRLFRLNSDGSIDATFQAFPGADAVAYGIAVQPDGSVIAAGAITSTVSVALESTFDSALALPASSRTTMAK